MSLVKKFIAIYKKVIYSLCEYVDIISNVGDVDNYHSAPPKIQLATIEKIDSFRKQANIADLYKFIHEHKSELYNYYFYMNYLIKQDCHYKFFYRGQSSVAYQLEPSVKRKKERHDERYYINNMKVRCSNELSGLTDIERLTFLQHYGCPTRLLDITSNPLIGLYFACQGSEKEDGVVNVFRINEKDVLYENSDRINMLAKLSVLKEEDQRELLRVAYCYLTKDKFPQKSGTGKYENKAVEAFYHMINMDNPVFERQIRPLDLLCPLFVQTALNNPRILKQDGAFIICGLDLDGADSDYKIKQYVCEQIIVPSECKNSILNGLERVCINEAALFPEVERVAAYLKK